MNTNAGKGRILAGAMRALPVGLSLVLLACGGGGGGGTAATDPPPATKVQPAARDYVADVKTYLGAYGAAMTKDIATNNVGVYYAETYELMGLAAATDVSGDAALLEALLGYTSQIMALAQPVVLNGVTSPELGPLVNGAPQQSLTFLIAGVLARTAAIIETHPAFAAAYGAQAAQLEAFVNQSVFQYWFDKVNGVYADPASPYPAGDIPWCSVALGGWGQYAYFPQQPMHLGILSAWMYQATQAPLYLDAATRLAEEFKTNHLVLVNGDYQWDLGQYTFEGGNEEGCQDTSHANRIPMMMQAMYENGIVFTAADMQALAGTLLNVIWNGSDTNPMFSNYIDGSDKPYQSTTAAGANGLIYDGWAMLGQDSAEAQRVVALSYQYILADDKAGIPTNPSLTVNDSSYGRMDLAGTLARNAGP